MVENEIGVAEVRSLLRDFFADGAALTEVRDIADGRTAGFSAERWQTLSVELGAAGLVVPDRASGLGLDARYATVALEELGAALSPAPLRATMTATLILNNAASQEDSSGRIGGWLEEIAAGTLVATVAVDPRGPGRSSLALAASDDFTAVTGTLPVVPDGAVAGLLIAPAASPAGADWVAVDLREAADRVVRTPLTGTDHSHGYADVELREAAGTRLRGDAAVPWEFAEDVATLLLAAEQIGVAAGCLDRAVAYAAERTQFGRIIGTYQAISHRLAETAVDVESGRGLVHLATAALVDGRVDDLRRLAPLAGALASRVSLAAADTLIQVHGGIGFTWEHDAHLYFRRARSLAAWFGSAPALEDLAATRGCHELLVA